MTGIEATLYSPELPTRGASCRLNFEGSILHIDGIELLDESGYAPSKATEAIEIPVHEIVVSTGGFHDDMLFLGWLYHNIQYSVVISDQQAQLTLADTAPTELALKLNRGRGELRYHQKKWNAVLASLGVFAVAILFAWWQSDSITAWLATKVSQRTEERIGNAMLTQLQSSSELTQQGLAVDTVKEIGDRLTQGSRYHYQWYVQTSSDVNAFAIPGGIVVVNSALIEKASTAEELAAVLAHEVQHVEYRHTLHQMIHSAGWAAVLAITLGDVSAITGIFAHQLGNLRHSRKLEGDADAEGLKALAEAHIPLDGMLSFMKFLQTEDDETDGTPIALLKTHPATSERVANIERLIGTMACDCQPLTLDWPAVHASLEK